MAEPLTIQIASNSDNMKGPDGLNLSEGSLGHASRHVDSRLILTPGDRNTLKGILEGLEAEFSKLLDGSTNTAAGSDGGVLDVSSGSQQHVCVLSVDESFFVGEVDSIIKEVEAVIKTVGVLEKVCKDNTSAVVFPKSLVDERSW